MKYSTCNDKSYQTHFKKVREWKFKERYNFVLKILHARIQKCFQEGSRDIYVLQG